MSDIQSSTSSSTPSPEIPISQNLQNGVDATQTAQKKQVVVVDGKVVILDTTSSAGATTQGIPQGTSANAGTPQLSPDSANMTSAQMYSLGMMVMDKARRQRIKSDAADAMKYQLTLGLKLGVVDTTPDVPKGPTLPGKTQNDSSSKTNTSVSSTDSTSTTQTTQTTDTTTSSTQTPPPVISNVSVKELRMGIAQLITLESTLANALYIAAKKQHKDANPLASPEQLTAFETAVKQFIDSYVHTLVTAGNANALGPSALYIKIPGVNALNTDSKIADAATAVTFSEYLMGLVHSGDIDKFASTYVFPQDPVAAKAFASNVGSILLDIGLEQVGTALNLQGLSQQVEAQAKLVRDENLVLENSVTLKGIVQQVALNNAQTSGLSQSDLETKSNKALELAISKGPFMTHQELFTTLKTSFENQFPTNQDLANLLANQIGSSVLDEALGKQKYPFPPLPINPDNINFTVLQTSILNKLQSDFIKTDKEVREAKKESDAVKAIVAEVVKKHYDNELAVRHDIALQLLSKIEMSPDQAADIAAKADLGIKHAGPLYVRGDNHVYPPNAFALNLQIGYQATVHASPTSDFGKAIEHVAGVAPGFDGTDMVALINQNYYRAPSESRSYLNLPASEQIKVQQQRLYDPGAQLVKEWAAVMNGVSGPKPNIPSGNSLPI